MENALSLFPACSWSGEFAQVVSERVEAVVWICFLTMIIWLSHMTYRLLCSVVCSPPPPLRDGRAGQKQNVEEKGGFVKLFFSHRTSPLSWKMARDKIDEFHSWGCVRVRLCFCWFQQNANHEHKPQVGSWKVYFGNQIVDNPGKESFTPERKIRRVISRCFSNCLLKDNALTSWQHP